MRMHFFLPRPLFAVITAVAGFIGQTAIKTKEKIDEAMNEFEDDDDRKIGF